MLKVSTGAVDRKTSPPAITAFARPSLGRIAALDLNLVPLLKALERPSVSLRSENRLQIYYPFRASLAKRKMTTTTFLAFTILPRVVHRTTQGLPCYRTLEASFLIYLSRTTRSKTCVTLARIKARSLPNSSVSLKNHKANVLRLPNALQLLLMHFKRKSLQPPTSS